MVGPRARRSVLEECPQEVADLIASCLSVTPKQRPSAKCIVQVRCWLVVLSFFFVAPARCFSCALGAVHSITFSEVWLRLQQVTICWVLWITECSDACLPDRRWPLHSTTHVEIARFRMQKYRYLQSYSLNGM